MFNPFQAMQMFSNPMGTMQNQLLQKMQQVNPQMFQQIQNLTSGKSETELKTMAENIAKERGIDLVKFANQFGMKI